MTIFRKLGRKFEIFFEYPYLITESVMLDAIRVSTINMSINPIICGSAFKNKGVQTLLDYVMEFLPSPMDVGAIEGTDEDGEGVLVREPRADEPMAALSCKIATDPSIGRLCLLRMYSGRLDAGSYIYNTRTTKNERISCIFQMHSHKQNYIDYIEAGDIGAGLRVTEIRT